MDAQLLTLTLLLLKEKIVPWRLVLASFAGGLGAVLVLMSGARFGAGYVLPVTLLDAFMLAVCMRGARKRAAVFGRLAMGIIYLHGMAFAYTRLTECADRLGGGMAARIAPTAVTAGIAAFILIYRGLAEQGRIYEVTLMENGEHVELKALFDTGNLLTDPVSGKPVSVVEETGAVRQWLTKYPQKYKVIPYRSIGREHGILEGIVVDELIVRREGEQVVEKDAVVALYEGRLSKDGAFQMILNHSLK